MSGATILQIVPRLDTGGAELSTVEIAQAVVGAGGRALVLTEGGRMAEDIRRHGGEIIPFPAGSKNPVLMALNGRAIERLVREKRVDLVHARSRAPGWSALMAVRRTGVPFVTTYHGAYRSFGPLKTLYNSSLARGDLVIANSRYTADLVETRHAVPEARIRVINRGVDLERFDPAKVAPGRIGALRQAWGVGAHERVVLHAGRLTAWKGQRIAIDAAAELVRMGGASHCVFVLAGDAQGRDAYAADLERRVVAAGLEDKVRLVGHCSDMPAAFATAYVSIVPSVEPEAFGRVTAEALAMGCPVIASDLGASPEIVRARDRTGPEAATGWLVAPGDAGALADAIAEALHLAVNDRAVMGRRARADIAERYSLEGMRRATLAVYDELLGTDLGAGYAATGPGNA